MLALVLLAAFAALPEATSLLMALPPHNASTFNQTRQPLNQTQIVPFTTRPLGVWESESGNDTNIINERALFRALNATLQKYNAGFSLPSLQKLIQELPNAADILQEGCTPHSGNAFCRRQADIELDDDNDYLYEASINVGHPRYQTFVMDFDTGKSVECEGYR